ncbi:MAG: hypothetical protein PHE48_04730 [Candidatus Daviesbacteria bacterium]|nr:hypothetical protein [Candidatus Daviesbacteria bacterium]
MRFQIKIFFIFLSLLVIFPVFALNSKPTFASASHIVRLKYEDGSPVVGKMVILRTGEYCNCDTDACPDCACYDCSRDVALWDQGGGCCNFDCGKYSTGPTWTVNTDSHGIAIFSARAGSNAGSGIGGGDLQTCSTGRNGRMVMGVAYLNGSGWWRLENVSNRPGGTETKDDSAPSACLKGHPNCCHCPDTTPPDERLRYNLAGDYEPCARYNEEGTDVAYWTHNFSSTQSYPIRANMAVSGLPYNCDNWSGDNPGTKTTNIYWEWTWIGSHAQNSTPQNKPLLAFANNLWCSISDLFSKITLAKNL